MESIEQRQQEQLRGLRMMQDEREHRRTFAEYTYRHFSGPDMQWSTLHDETNGRTA